MCRNSKRKIIFCQIHHIEKISPVMCIFTHSSDKWKRPGSCIGNIERDISQILSKPPECHACGKGIIFPNEEYIGEKKGKENLKKTSSENREKFSKRHKYDMASFVEYKVWAMYKSIHHFGIDSKSEKLEWIKNEQKIENYPSPRKWRISSCIICTIFRHRKIRGITLFLFS